MSALAIDHVITRDQHVWAFGPSMTPVSRSTREPWSGWRSTTASAAR